MSSPEKLVSVLGRVVPISLTSSATRMGRIMQGKFCECVFAGDGVVTITAGRAGTDKQKLVGVFNVLGGTVTISATEWLPTAYEKVNGSASGMNKGYVVFDMLAHDSIYFSADSTADVELTVME